ncbi:MAG: efflux RND transporter periplasmic adaptor subunit [Acidobacteriota bacterium]|nr:efflux RND transporter periplasmic adaptor subunit [Acidobacteriota bacterium]
MKSKSLLLIVAIVIAAIGASLWLLRSDTAGPEEHEEGEAAAEYPRGPHGARLLPGDDFQVEVTIYEAGVEPHFRIYPLDRDGRPIAPAEVTLRVELHRLGGRVDRIAFVPEADYLRGEAVVEEPHSFDVKVHAVRNGRTQEWSYSQVEGKVQLADETLKSAGIEIQAVGPRPMSTSFEVTGEITADRTRVAQVVPRLQGVVVEVLKQEGDRVQRGELMAIINSRELADAKSAFLAAGQRVQFARTALGREENLWKKKISAEQEFLEARRAFDEVRLSHEVASQKLVALGLSQAAVSSLGTAAPDSLPRYEVRAPIGGTVVERDLTIGESVAADHSIFVIADLSSVWIEAAIPAKDLIHVRQGQPATVRATDTGLEATGRISFIGALVGGGSRKATARIVVPNTGGAWRPGLFVTVTLEQSSAVVALAVPAEAIQTFRDWQVVFVRYGDWFEARPLELGRSDGTWVEVLSGLTAGERFAATNSFAVKAEIGKLGATHDH